MPLIRVASFNAHYGYDTRGRAFDVAAVCRDLGADVLVVQESWLPDDRVSDVDRAASEMGYTVTHEAMGTARISGHKPRLVSSGRADGKLAISMLSRLPVRGTRVIEMHHLPLDSAPRRFAIALDVEVDGEVFSYVGTHLDHLTHGSPYQLTKLRRELPGDHRSSGRGPGSDRPAALAGDMNMWGPVLSLLMPGWRRAVKGRTWPNVFPHSQIDHIMVNPLVRVRGYDVLHSGRSDHRPVRADLEF